MSRFDQLTADAYADDRQPAGDTPLVLPNPSNKVIGRLGMPASERKFAAAGMRQRECRFVLPIDWQPVDETGDHGTRIVARQNGTARCVIVEHPDGPVSISEVLG